MNLLVVDNDDDVREVLTELLALYGHAIHTAKTGTAGLFHASVVKPTVVMVDMVLADMSGCDFVRALRRQPWAIGTYIIAFSGYPEHWKKNERQAAGFNHYLGKPLSIEHLNAVLVSAPGSSHV